MKLKPPITPETVEQALQYLESIRGDDEYAHGFEDDLRDAVLKTIAANPDSADNARIAALALQTERVDFSRWCA